MNTVPNSNFIADTMVCAMARMIQDGETVFSGLASHMPVAAIQLARALHAPNAWQLNTAGGVNSPDAPWQSHTSIGRSLQNGTTTDFGLPEVFDLSMRGGLDVAFLSGAQFDRTGAVNTSVIGDYHRPKVRFPGGAGSAVLLPTAKRAILWRPKHDRRTFVEKVDFVTTRGNIDKVVTNLGILTFENGAYSLLSVHPGVRVHEVQEQTGFVLDCSRATVTPEPTRKELSILQKIDPKGYRYQEMN
ncbi:MAG: CoA-transferase subunit beta [Christensenellales bacterium]|jgi:glutaconate CoA-transferase subunit B